jgi:glycosyltransferase involved in cell wall biosynthesis
MPRLPLGHRWALAAVDGSADLRIAVVSPFVDRSHGTERAIAELMERLARVYQCEIHLYAQRVADLAIQPSKAVPAQNAGAILWHKVPSVPGPQVIAFTWWLLANSFLRRFDSLLDRASVDLVLSPGINCLSPDVVVVHALFQRLQGLSRETSETPGGSLLLSCHRRGYYLLLTCLERFVYRRRSVHLAAVSQRTADLIAQYFRRDAVVIPNGVDNQQFSAAARLARRAEARRSRGFRDTDFVVLLIGNDWRTKGLPTILAAMAAAPTLPLRLLAVGSDSLAPFQAMAARLGVANRCTWAGPQCQVIELYASADVYASPTREDSFGLPVAEAMACGLPIITSAMAGVSAQIRHNVDGFVLSEPHDVVALTEIFTRLHADEILRTRIGQAAAQAAQQWNWDRSAAALWELLASVIKEKEAGRSRSSIIRLP